MQWAGAWEAQETGIRKTKTANGASQRRRAQGDRASSKKSRAPGRNLFAAARDWGAVTEVRAVHPVRWWDHIGNGE